MIDGPGGENQEGTSPRDEDVSVVTVTYWTGDVLKKCIKALCGTHVGEIIIVDNGNPASVAEWLDGLSQECDRIKIIRPTKNLGFAAGCNLGVQATQGAFVALVNPDCILETDTITRILAIAASDEQNWICGGRLQSLDGSEQRGSRRETLTPWRAIVEQLRLDRFAPNHPYFRRFHQFANDAGAGTLEVPTISGAFMLIRRSAYMALDGMDERYFLHMDDSDICMRAWKAGGRVLFCGDVPVLHLRSTSDVSETFIVWHKSKSVSYYFYKHFKDTYPWWILHFVFVLIWTRFVLVMPYRIFNDLPGIIIRFLRRKC